MDDRQVVKASTGEIFIETTATLWQERMRQWSKDHSKPCPMPAGHLMFRRPADYGCRLIEDVAIQPDLL